ncbi:hypothetical protein [Citrobacter freundii]|uniref:Uncharacterized protein n=1 Tax=Citrobacter freundii TaxID=546 RepID=A0A7G2IT09_CITFR|nr:hypothetical protein [Citrobacter freundii]
MTLSCGLCCEFNRLRVALFVVSHFFLIRSADLQAESACSKPLKIAHHYRVSFKYSRRVNVLAQRQR